MTLLHRSTLRRNRHSATLGLTLLKHEAKKQTKKHSGIYFYCCSPRCFETYSLAWVNSSLGNFLSSSIRWNLSYDINDLDSKLARHSRSDARWVYVLRMFPQIGIDRQPSQRLKESSEKSRSRGLPVQGNSTTRMSSILKNGWQRYSLRMLIHPRRVT